MGPKHPGTGSLSGRGYADGRQCSMDKRLGKRIPGAAVRRDGRSPAHARKGSRYRESKNQRPIGSANRDYPQQREAGHQDRASEPRRCLCAFLRPDCGVRSCPSRLSLLSLYLSGLRSGDSLDVGRRNCAGCRSLGLLGWPLGGLRLERWQRQDQQQL